MRHLSAHRTIWATLIHRSERSLSWRQFRVGRSLHFLGLSSSRILAIESKLLGSIDISLIRILLCLLFFQLIIVDYVHSFCCRSSSLSFSIDSGIHSSPWLISSSGTYHYPMPSSLILHPRRTLHVRWTPNPGNINQIADICSASVMQLIQILTLSKIGLRWYGCSTRLLLLRHCFDLLRSRGQSSGPELRLRWLIPAWLIPSLATTLRLFRGLWRRHQIILCELNAFQILWIWYLLICILILLFKIADSAVSMRVLLDLCVV